MSVYIFWNNKGGTGKTSLCFQSVCLYAECNPEKKILVIDMCPQANLSELFLGGLIGDGSQHLASLFEMEPRMSVGGYFQSRLPSPFTIPDIHVDKYICKPKSYNNNIPENIDLLAGDHIIELQSNPIATLSNTQIPGTNTWLGVINWIKDFIDQTSNKYDDIFIDANPSFSVYTQIAISASDLMILPVMADDSSRRAVQNVFSLVHGLKLPTNSYLDFTFSKRLENVGRTPPKVHIIIKNRLTQYITPASAYYSVLTSIDQYINKILSEKPEVFSFKNINNGIVEIRDFQTTGVVAFAEGKPFKNVNVGTHSILNRKVNVKAAYLDNCNKAMNQLVKLI